MIGRVIFSTLVLPEDGGVNRCNGNVLHDGMCWNG